jgi:tetratricopeptide (TPR) repeat protein
VECDVVVTKAGLAYRRRSAPRFERIVMPRETAHVAHDLIEAEQIQEQRTRDVETPDLDLEPEGVVSPSDRIAHGDGDIAALVMRVRALADGGSSSAADEVCRSALASHPLSAELLYLQSVLLYHARRSAEAVEMARRALYLDRSLVVAHVALGDALLRLGTARRLDVRRAYESARRILSRMEPDAIVPASGGERCARLHASVAARLQLMQTVS